MAELSADSGIVDISLLRKEDGVCHVPNAQGIFGTCLSRDLAWNPTRALVSSIPIVQIVCTARFAVVHLAGL
jgi:hypothetical protein